MDLIGEELRIRRESKGLSLREVEDATKIRYTDCFRGR